jgi:hypothetical protein
VWRTTENDQLMSYAMNDTMRIGQWEEVHQDPYREDARYIHIQELVNVLQHQKSIKANVTRRVVIKMR